MSLVACEDPFASCCGGMAVTLTRTSVAHIDWKVHCFSHIFRFLVKSSRQPAMHRTMQDFLLLLRYLPVFCRLFCAISCTRSIFSDASTW
eukprot:s275_g39.t1